jgi:cobalt/nickel transport system permease protein
MLPVWALAGQRVRQSLGARQVPLLALGAAFCFTIMMFNIPALGGTTAHPVAGTLLAVTLGPWAAVIGMSVALAIQALFFGDGGLLAYGTNCFTMGFVLPFVGYSVYRLLCGIGGTQAARRQVLIPLLAAIGAYIGINAAAAVVAVLLGVQPVFFHKPDGSALYFPFGLKITLPAMLGTHLLIAGPAEAIVTGLVVRYLQAARIPLYGEERGKREKGRDLPNAQRPTPNAQEREEGRGEETARGRWQRREALWIGLLAVVALSPLGLLASGDAWGEWDAQGVAKQIQKVEGRAYVPEAIAQAEAHGYKGVHGLEDYASEHGARGYIGAALLGVGTIVVLLLGLGRMFVRRGRDSGSKNDDEDAPTPPTARVQIGEIPAWMQRSSEEYTEVVAEGRPMARRSEPNRFLERTLSEITASTAAALYGETWARQSGYLQRLDPRAKLIAFLGLIAVVACVHNALTLLSLYALTLLMAWASRLPAGLLVKRVWLSVPVFVGAIALPAAFSLVTPGRALLVIWRAPYLAITVPGLELAALLMLRVGVAVSLAVLLTLTTPWNDLLRGLRALWVPRLFISVLAMTYRYVAVLMQTAAEMFIARRSRTVGRATNAEGRRFVGASIGALFGKTLALSEEVHAAMVARGFQGEMQTLTALRWCAADSAWVVAILLVALAALGGEYV